MFPRVRLILASPHLSWLEFVNGERFAKLWAAAAFKVPYTDEVGEAVADTLASDDTLRPHILHEYRTQRTKEQYEGLKAALLEVDGEATNVLIREFL